MPETRTRKQRYRERKKQKKQRKIKEISKLCYENNKERLQKMNWGQYRGLFEEKKLKKIGNVKSRYRNMLEENKQKVKEYGKNTDKICLKKTNKKEKNTWNNIWENTKKLIQQIIEENKGKRWVEKCWSRYGKQFHQKWCRKFFWYWWS